MPRIALTATADERTRDEIVTELRLGSAQRFIASFDRPNIRYTISDMGAMGARERLWQFLEAEHAEDAGIVYCLSRKSVEETAAWLGGKGRTALAYHAGLDAQVRRGVLQRFRKDSGVIVVATIAFGMGIDKPDVRFVAHLNLPKSIEAYYQETGRAGRDGLAGERVARLRPAGPHPAAAMDRAERRLGSLQADAAPEARGADRAVRAAELPAAVAAGLLRRAAARSRAAIATTASARRRRWTARCWRRRRSRRSIAPASASARPTSSTC